MKKIINGKRYDTNTAKMVGETSYGNWGDFDFWSEELYQKKTGEFFLYGIGGAMSRYAQRISQNQWGGGEQIIPLTPAEAQEWAEKYLDADKYEKIFGRIEEGKTQIATWINDTLKSAADELREKGYTWADIFEAGIQKLQDQ
jgi:hypothetical protein